MTVVYCANRKIYPQLLTTLNSLLINNPQIEKIYLLIEDDYIENINHPKVIFINCNNFDFLIRKGINCTRQFPYMAMVRCFLTKILNEDKIIYLDIDTVVNGSIQELWDIQLGGNCIAAREEYNGYINSGVLLMNLDLIRKLKYDDKLARLLKSCKFIFPDQDAMNIVFKNKIKFIPYKFNAIGRDEEAYGQEYIIRHFAGITKPWKKNASKLDKELWNKYKVNKIN